MAHRIRVLARRSSDHLAVRLLIVLTSPHSYRSPVDRVTGLLAPAPAKRAIAKRFRALAIATFVRDNLVAIGGKADAAGGRANDGLTDAVEKSFSWDRTNVFSGTGAAVRK